MSTNKKTGYTIIEVMLFLVISGAMFTIAYFGTRNAQDNVAFRQSLDDIELKIKEVFNNVDNGYFGNSGGFTCKKQGNEVEVNTGSGGGDSSECVFIGKEVWISDPKSMTIDTRIAQRGDDTRSSIPEELKEQYTIKNAVEYTQTKLDTAIHTGYNFRIRAIRTQDDTTDIKARRQYSINNGLAWNTITDITSTQPKMCFALGGRKGSIIITQKAVEVSYNDVNC